MPFVQIKVTVPKQVVNVEAVRRSIIDTQNTTTWNALNGLFRKTIEGWSTPPFFDHRRIDTSSQLGIFVHPAGPNRDQWVIVNEGARPHEIRPRRARMLRFQPGYRASTRPGSLTSRSKQRFGKFVRKSVVYHPGFEARDFTQTIADEHAPDFRRDMNRAIARGARSR